MIIPNYYSQALSKATFTDDVIGKWCCSYHEEYKDMFFARYLHPTGWKTYNYWWESKEEMERVFNRIGQERVYVSEREYAEEKMALEDWRADYCKSAIDELEELCGGQ